MYIQHTTNKQPVTDYTFVRCKFMNTPNNNILLAENWTWDEGDITEYECVDESGKPLTYGDIQFIGDKPEVESPVYKHNNIKQDRLARDCVISPVDENASNNSIAAFTAQDFLEQAKQLMDERGKQYDSDSGERSAGKVARAYNAISSKDLKAEDIWLIMLLLKQVRQWTTEEGHLDSASDSVAYASLLAECLMENKDDS